MRKLIVFLLVSGCAPGVDSVPVADDGRIVNASLSAPVDVLFDEHGIPHIYGSSFGDVAFVEGYLMARDRMLQLDLLRRTSGGTLAELVGELSPSVVATDAAQRMHHNIQTADAAWAQLQASADPDDQALAKALTAYAAGVNAYAADLQAGKYTLPPDVVFLYGPDSVLPWQERDSILVGMLIAFNLSYTADDDIARSRKLAASAAAFDNGATADLMARAGFGQDLITLAPAFPVYTLPGDFSTLEPRPGGPQSLPLAALDAAHRTLKGQGLTRVGERGSNDWIVGPKLTKNGHVLVANDPHLALSTPPIFYMVHLVVSGTDALDVFGAQFPGAPGVILGANQRVAWGSTTSDLDVTDVYAETLVTCDGAQPTDPPGCVVYNGAQVALTPRTETIKIGKPGAIGEKSLTITLFDVPQHGPIVPTVNSDGTVAPLAGTTAMSVRWTGYEPTQLLRAVWGLNHAASVSDAMTQLEDHFTVGGQNWVLGDVDGHFGWTQAVRVPRRPAGTKPWLVLPGDGSAEWGADLSQRWIPHAYDPDIGFLATANADPVGVTDDNEPFASEPLVDGIPLYIGADFDPGSRVARITEQLTALAARGGITSDDLVALQNDHVSKWDQLLLPTLTDAAQALDEEMMTPGTHPELTPLLTQAAPTSLTNISGVRTMLAAWDFDTPADSATATVVGVWQAQLGHFALDDELAVVGESLDSSQELKILDRMCNHPEKMSVGRASTGDSTLFDDITTTTVVESKRFVAARALLASLDWLGVKLGTDPTAWQWGQIHTLAFEPLLPIQTLRIPATDEPGLAAGWPRPGSNGTVDVGANGLSLTDFSYGAGPVQRAVYEVDPAGMKGQNCLPGGEVFNPASPHFRDLADEWVTNTRFTMWFAQADVIAAAQKEIAANGGGRWHFSAN